MKRIILASVLAVAVAYTGHVEAQQGARGSRWQPEQFGPIVPTDTMWSISQYYARQRGVSMFDMMDAIVAENPRAFRDNRPDFMLTGFFLTIPELGDASNSAAPTAATAENRPAAEPEPATATATTDTAEPATSEEATDTTPVDETEIAISVSEMQALRTQLSDSIGLIENLQGENQELQQKLASVTEELNALRAAADAEQRASAEMELIKDELAAGSDGEQTAETVAAEPETLNPAATDEAADAGPVVTEEPAADTSESQATASDTASEAEDAAPPVVTSEPQQAERTTPARKQTSWVDWLMKPLHLGIIGLLLVLTLGGLWYAAYLRRINKEFEEQPQAADVETDATTETDVADVKAEAAAAVATVTVADEHDWQEQALPPQNNENDDVEVSDVDLDEYLREHGDELEDDDDVISKEVDELLAFEPETLDDDLANEVEPDKVGEEESEPVPEYRPMDDEPESLAEEEQETDSFGGLRLDDDASASTDTDDDDGYLSIESLMEEADTEASEDSDDPYDKDKIGDALGGDEGIEHDLSTEELLDESKTPAARLDLAQVYIEMGEVDDAREILEQLQDCGDAEAEAEAEALLKKLEEQGGR
ncbi:FimV/HubP family polar landmark protein [Pseudidiomarina salilacus]|uniref:FimV/HubP family polar landmark protein n=1 Tax=Pseudidiomarina salilacus TaxID=3384452 RepID=UPI003984BCCE